MLAMTINDKVDIDKAYNQLFLEIEKISEKFSATLLPDNNEIISEFYNIIKPLMSLCDNCFDEKLCEKVRNMPNFMYILGIVAYYLGDISEIENQQDQLKYHEIKSFYIKWTEYNFTRECGYELIDLSNSYNAYCFLGNYFE